VKNLNDNQLATFSPSHQICVDESTSRRYDLGGSLINMGFPQYVSIDRKPENGCEIQNSACEVSIKLVKAAESQDEAEDQSAIEDAPKVQSYSRSL
jgi:hypothetical protein